MSRTEPKTVVDELVDQVGQEGGDDGEKVGHPTPS